MNTSIRKISVLVIIGLALAIQTSSFFGVDPEWELNGVDIEYYGYYQFPTTKDGTWPSDFPLNSFSYLATFGNSRFFEECFKPNCGLSATRFSIASNRGFFLEPLSVVEFGAKKINALPSDIKRALAKFYELDTDELYNELTYEIGVQNIHITDCIFRLNIHTLSKSKSICALTNGLNISDFVILPHGVGEPKYIFEERDFSDLNNHHGRLFMGIFERCGITSVTGTKGQIGLYKYSFNKTETFNHYKVGPLVNMQIHPDPNIFRDLSHSEKPLPTGVFYKKYLKYPQIRTDARIYNIPVFNYSGDPFVISVNGNNYASFYVVGITPDKKNIVITHALLINYPPNYEQLNYIASSILQPSHFPKKIADLMEYAKVHGLLALNDTVLSLATLSGNEDILTPPMHTATPTTTTAAAGAVGTSAQTLEQPRPDAVVHKTTSGVLSISPATVATVSAEAHTPTKQAYSISKWYRSWKSEVALDGHIIVNGPVSTNDYIFDLPLITFKKGECIAMRGTLKNGTLGFGLLSSDRKRWIVTPQNTSANGDFVLSLTPPEAGSYIPMIVDRSSSKDKTIECEITDILFLQSSNAPGLTTQTHPASSPTTITSTTVSLSGNTSRQDPPAVVATLSADAHTPTKQAYSISKWYRLKSEAALDGRITVNGPASTNDFIFDLPLITFKKGECIAMRGTLKNGTLGFGLLSSDRKRWIVTPQNTSANGDFVLSLTPPEAGSYIPMIVDRSSSKDKTIECEVADISVY